jgi:hypothetical protein
MHGKLANGEVMHAYILAGSLPGCEFFFYVIPAEAGIYFTKYS